MQLTTDLLVDYAAELSFEDLPDEAVAAAKRLVFDSVGCCLGAYSSPPSKYLRRTYGGLRGGDTASVFGSEDETLLEYAALVNATMVRYLDYNDTYISQGRACHPSDHIPALVSVAEVEGASGTDLLEAIVLAYEIEGLGLDTGVTWEYDYDYTTWGAYSSAAAVGKLMGLSADELQNAIGIAGTSNLTLSVARRGEVSMWKGIAHSYVAHCAIQACQMARSGITGPSRVFEGPGGFDEVAAKGPISVDRLGGRDGARYRICDAHIKPFPCGYYMQPMIAAVQELVEEHDVTPDELESIDIETFEQAATILGTPEKWNKDLTRESADHSIPYTAAITVLYGDVTPEHYGESYRRDEKVHELMDLVSVEETEEIDEFSNENPDSTPCVVRLTAGSKEYTKRMDYGPGHARNPLSDEQLRAKMVDMAEPLLTGEQIEQIVSVCDSLEEQSTVDDLVESLVI